KLMTSEAHSKPTAKRPQKAARSDRENQRGRAGAARCGLRGDALAQGPEERLNLFNSLEGSWIAFELLELCPRHLPYRIHRHLKLIEQPCFRRLRWRDAQH